MFNPQDEVQKATSSSSIFSPNTNNSSLSYSPGGLFFGSTQPTTSSQQEAAQQRTTGYDAISTGSKLFKKGSSAIDEAGGALGFATTSSPSTYLANGALPWQTAGSVVNPSVAAETLAAGPSNIISGGAGKAGSLSTATLSQTLGAAAFGASVGGLLNKKNPVAGMIGGGVGGAIGSAALGGLTTGLGAALAGTQIGAAVGSIIPGLGTVIGAFAGGLASKAFGGGKPATNADAFFTTLNTDGSVETDNFTSKNAGSVAGFAKSQETQLTDIAKAANKELGIDFSDIAIGGGISTRHGGASLYAHPKDFKGEWYVPRTFYNPDDQAEVNNLQKEILLSVAKAKGYQDLDAVSQWFDKKVNSGNTTGVVNSAPNIADKQAPISTPFKQFMEQYASQQTANAV